MIIKYRDKDEIDTSLINEKLELIANSSTENATYLSKILLKALAFLFPKPELHADFLQVYDQIIEDNCDAVIYFSNGLNPTLKISKPLIIIGNNKTSLKDNQVLYVHVKDLCSLRKLIKKYSKVAIGFNPDDIAFSKYYDIKMRRYFWNVLDTLDKMNISLIEKDVEKACTYLLLDKSRFVMNLPNEKEKIVLKKMMKVYQELIERCPNQVLNNGKKMFYTETIKTPEKIMMLNEMSVFAEIFAMPRKEDRVSKIYDIMCKRMLEEAHELSYCQFENNRCIASRYTDGFPNSKENGCCQNTYLDRDKNCRFLQSDYSCKICSISCRFFSCAYLQKRGIDHALYQYPLIDVTFGKLKKTEIVHDFFTPKAEMMKRLT